MNRSDLVAELAGRAGMTLRAARETLDLLFGVGRQPGLIPQALQSGERVSISGFGVFAPRRRTARSIAPPGSAGRPGVTAGRAVVFRAGAGLRDLLR